MSGFLIGARTFLSARTGPGAVTACEDFRGEGGRARQARAAPAGGLLPPALLGALLLLPCAPRAAEDFSQWARSAGVFLNTTADGANVTSDIPGFPVLVRLAGGGAFSFAKAAGDG